MENSYLSLPPLFYQRVKASTFTKVSLLLFNENLSQQLGLELDGVCKEELADIFSGQKLLAGSMPIALAYAGYQFGHPVPLLGDGRAMLLGEMNGQDIQLKGSGQTPYSRRGDGLSELGPVLREYIVSEFMHTIGIPTTRALAAVLTGQDVYRQFGAVPGAVFTRVASSHLRVGTFQLASFNQDQEALIELLDYTVKRHYPHLSGLPLQQRALTFLAAVGEKQGELIAKWSSVGFIHGVMNTDNCSVAGITIDYGPCAFMDEFSFNKVFSSIDERGRYSYFNQVPIIQWNILRLADCLLPLISQNQEEAISLVENMLHPILGRFHHLRMKYLASKLGINDYQEEDEVLVMDFLKYLEESSLDFTLAFRNLWQIYNEENEFYPESIRLNSFIEQWKLRVKDISGLHLINPLYIPRNHLVQKAIELSYQGEMSFTHRLLEVLADPFTEREGFQEFSQPPKDSEKVLRTYCGT